MLRRFVKLAGGRSASIVIIPTASSFPEEVTESYQHVFTGCVAVRYRSCTP